MKRIEFLCLLLFALAILMAYNGMAAAKPIILLAATVCTIFYAITGIGVTRGNFLPTAWKNTAPEMRSSLVMKTLSGIGFALSIIAISSNELFLHSSSFLNIAAIVVLTAIMFLSMRLLEENQPKLNRGILARSALFSVGLTFYVIAPLPNRLAWRFEDVYYRELLQFAMEHPADEDAQSDLLDYERRMEGHVSFEPLE